MKIANNISLYLCYIFPTLYFILCYEGPLLSFTQPDLSILRKSIREIWIFSGTKGRDLERGEREAVKDWLAGGWGRGMNGSAQLKLPWNYFPVNRGHVSRSDHIQRGRGSLSTVFLAFQTIVHAYLPTLVLTLQLALFFREENNYSRISVS